MAYLGQVKLVPYDFVPRDFAECNGALLPIAQNTALFSVLGATYGGDARTTFGVPDLRDRVPVHQTPQDPLGARGGAASVTLTVATMPQHAHPVMASTEAATQTAISGNMLAAQAARGTAHYIASSGSTVDMTEHALTKTGNGQPHENRQPSLVLRYIITTQGNYPSREGIVDIDGEDYVGEIRAFGFNFAPRGWAMCDGQLMPINGNESLFTLIGTKFGGDGRTTFALPDLRGRVPVGAHEPVGTTFGAETVKLQPTELPAHDHQTELGSGAPDTGDPAGAMIASGASILNDGPFDTSFAAGTVGAPVPNGQPHGNMMPYLAVNYCICLVGLFPSRN